MMCSLTQRSLNPSASARRAWSRISVGLALLPACGKWIPICTAIDRFPRCLRDPRPSQCPDRSRAGKGGAMRFHDRVAVITAAASGIGRATAEIVAHEGGIVVAVDNHQE